jgi:hypothetical protein
MRACDRSWSVDASCTRKRRARRARAKGCDGPRGGVGTPPRPSRTLRFRACGRTLMRVGRHTRNRAHSPAFRGRARPALPGQSDPENDGVGTSSHPLGFSAASRHRAVEQGRLDTRARAAWPRREPAAALSQMRERRYASADTGAMIVATGWPSSGRDDGPRTAQSSGGRCQSAAVHAQITASRRSSALL